MSPSCLSLHLHFAVPTRRVSEGPGGCQSDVCCPVLSLALRLHHVLVSLILNSCLLDLIRGSSPHTWLCPALGQTVRLPISALASRCLAPDPSEGRKVASTAGRPAPSARTGRKGPQPCPASGALSSGCACSRGHLVCTDRFCMNIHAASARTGRWCLRKQNGALSWSPRVTNEGQTLALDAGAFV